MLEARARHSAQSNPEPDTAPRGEKIHPHHTQSLIARFGLTAVLCFGAVGVGARASEAFNTPPIPTSVPSQHTQEEPDTARIPVDPAYLQPSNVPEQSIDVTIPFQFPEGSIHELFTYTSPRYHQRVSALETVDDPAFYESEEISSPIDIKPLITPGDLVGSRKLLEDLEVRKYVAIYSPSGGIFNLSLIARHNEN